MPKFVFQQNYRSSYGGGTKGDKVDLSDDLAAAIERDAPGTLMPWSEHREIVAEQERVEAEALAERHKMLAGMTRSELNAFALGRGVSEPASFKNIPDLLNAIEAFDIMADLQSTFDAEADKATADETVEPTEDDAKTDESEERAIDTPPSDRMQRRGRNRSDGTSKAVNDG